MIVMPNIMDLGVTVMATGNTVIGTGGSNLVKFHLTVSPAFLGISCLQKATATATAIIIGSVRRHLYDVFFANHRFDNETQIIGNRLAKTLADDLAGILDGKLYLKIFIPVGIDL